MKKIFAAALAVLTLTWTVNASALEAFHSLTAPDSAVESSADDAAVKARDAILGSIMAGTYTDASGGTAQTLSDDLELLCTVTNRDIALYASANGLKAAQVRNAYFKALAELLKAELASVPDTDEKRQNAGMILALFLDLTEETATDEKETIRVQMTPASSAEIARDYSLPEAFVEFVIMDADWNDASWENDSDWMSGTAWETVDGSVLPDITIGMRDDANSTRIADLQTQLINLGYLKGKADGVFGARTQAALLEFQLANAMTSNGIYTGRVDRKLTETDVVARWDYKRSFWNPDDDTPDYDTPDYNTPNDNTPDYNTPDYNTPDYYTPDYNTPDYNTPDYNTPDYNTPDYNTPDYNT